MPLDIAQCGLCQTAVVVAEGARPICDNCREEELRLYNQIRELLRKSGGTLTVADVSKTLKVEERKINFLVEGGMFKFVHSRTLPEGGGYIK
jgi:hypothetical protein